MKEMIKEYLEFIERANIVLKMVLCLIVGFFVLALIGLLIMIVTSLISNPLIFIAIILTILFGFGIFKFLNRLL